MQKYLDIWKRWDLGRKIVLGSGVLMLVFLIITWLNTRGESLQDIRMAIKWAKSYGSSNVDLNRIASIVAANDWRWVLLLPMILPIYAIFCPTKIKVMQKLESNIKNYACISACVTSVVALILCLVGGKSFTAVAWVFFVISLFQLGGCCMLKPALADAPAAPTAPVAAGGFCPYCGAQNASDSAFCLSCGKKLG